MFIKNILVTAAIASLAIAAPTEDLEARDLEARDPPACPGNIAAGNSWCCQSTVPFSFLFIQGVGNKCNKAPPPWQGGCPRGTSALCCQNKQIVNGKDVVCTK